MHKIIVHNDNDDPVIKNKKNTSSQLTNLCMSPYSIGCHVERKLLGSVLASHSTINGVWMNEKGIFTKKLYDFILSYQYSRYW